MCFFRSTCICSRMFLYIGNKHKFVTSQAYSPRKKQGKLQPSFIDSKRFLLQRFFKIDARKASKNIAKITHLLQKDHNMPNFVRASKFRHVFGTGSKRDHSYDGMKVSKNSWDAPYCAANPKFIAIVLESAGGGSFLVLPLEKVGKFLNQICLSCISFVQTRSTLAAFEAIIYGRSLLFLFLVLCCFDKVYNNFLCQFIQTVSLNIIGSSCSVYLRY